VRRTLAAALVAAVILVIAVVAALLPGRHAGPRLSVTTSPRPDAEPAAPWKLVDDPARLGWDTGLLAAAKMMWESNGGTSAVFVAQGGAAIAAWGDVAARWPVRSIRKSLLSAMIGIHVAEGRLARDQTLGELGVAETTALTDRERSARLADLLTSRSGVYLPAAKETPSNRRRRRARGSHAPGTFFYYNNWDFNVLGTLAERASGGDLFSDFERRVARPIGMEDFRASDGQRARESVSIHPAHTFDVSARDLARFGLLYLRHGRWAGRQVVPAEWVDESTRAHAVDPRQKRGYGYLWWVAPAGTLSTGPVFFADGAGWLWVVPDRDLVVVHLNRVRWLVPETMPGLVPREETAWEVLRTILKAAPRRG
jgi:CubicO group peptidase (beta-lactamase class C family)